MNHWIYIVISFSASWIIVNVTIRLVDQVINRATIARIFADAMRDDAESRVTADCHRLGAKSCMISTPILAVALLMGIAGQSHENGARFAE
jgi:hypothetical protein